MTIIGGLTWRLRLVTFVHVPFSPPPLLILAFQPILFHTIVTEGHYMLFFIVGQSCLIVACQMTCQRSHICWCASCWHHVFVLPVQSALIYFENLILSSLAGDWCCFPSRRLPYTSICSSIFVFLRSMFAFIPPFVDFVRLYLTFWHGMIQIQYVEAHAKSPLTIPCVLYAAVE